MRAAVAGRLLVERRSCNANEALARSKNKNEDEDEESRVVAPLQCDDDDDDDLLGKLNFAARPGAISSPPEDDRLSRTRHISHSRRRRATYFGPADYCRSADRISREPIGLTALGSPWNSQPRRRKIIEADSGILEKLYQVVARRRRRRQYNGQLMTILVTTQSLGRRRLCSCCEKSLTEGRRRRRGPTSPPVGCN